MGLTNKAMAITTYLVSGVTVSFGFCMNFKVLISLDWTPFTFAKSWDLSWISSIKECILQVSAAFISSVFGLLMGKKYQNSFCLEIIFSHFAVICCQMPRSFYNFLN